MSINCLTLRWFESIIHPLHKKYDINSPDNNRGISLLNTSNKIYSYILTQWVEEKSVIHEVQAGFRRNCVNSVCGISRGTSFSRVFPHIK